MRDQEGFDGYCRVQREYYAGLVDEDQLASVLAPDVTWHVPGSNALAGDHRGRAAVLRYFGQRRRMADATLRIVVHGEAQLDDLVVTRADGTARVDGDDATWQTVGIYRLAGGRIAECWMVPLDQEGFDRVWRSPVDRLHAAGGVRQCVVRVVCAPAAEVDRGLRAVTLADMPMARVLFSLRRLPLRLLGRRALPTGDSEPFVDAMMRQGVSRLVDRPGIGLVVGLIGQPWRPTGGETVRAQSIAEFAGFDRPGSVKVVERFRYAPVDATDTVVVDELAACCTDDVSARRFHRYWRVVGPGSRVVRRQLLAAAGHLAVM